MKRTAVFILVLNCFVSFVKSQPAPQPDRPKLVVGMVVDQMRWDFLYRYYDRYRPDGFKRLLNKGFSAENALIPYAQTVTAAGHSCVYTGSVPSVSGIVGNEWYDREKKSYVYCVEDSTVNAVGGVANSEPMSPRNMQVTSLGDELRLASNFRSKSVGVAIKDRGSILPAGHSGTAYWYESANGNWISSTWYMQQLPPWVQAFNKRRVTDSLSALNWETRYPLDTYSNSDVDDAASEGKLANESKPVFPHILKGDVGKNYGNIRTTPHGNTLTLEFAKAALLGENLGKGTHPDLLAISLSSPDYTGHVFGPNSIEIEDTYLRLDEALAGFFQFLDKQVGENQWVFFLSADHGVAHVPRFLNQNKIPASSITKTPRDSLNKLLNEVFGISGIIEASANNQLYLKKLPAEKQDSIEQYLVRALKGLPYVADAFSYRNWDKLVLPAEVRETFAKGYHPRLSGDIQLVLKPGYFFGGPTGTTHGSWYPYDAHIPLIFMGKGIKPGKLYRTVYMTDIAPTLASLLRIQMPNGSIGSPIVELFR